MATLPHSGNPSTITRTHPPFWAVRMHSSMPWMRYGRHVQMSDPNTSLPLHSSCTRTVSSMSGLGMVDTSPKM